MPTDLTASERMRQVRRMVADRVLANPDLYFGTPVGELRMAEAAILQAALDGPHSDEVINAMVKFANDREDNNWTS